MIRYALFGPDNREMTPIAAANVVSLLLASVLLMPLSAQPASEIPADDETTGVLSFCRGGRP